MTRLARVLAVVAALLVVGVLVGLALRQAEEPAAPFPTELLQAQGVLLTALVFFLTFGQARLRRACDEILRGARDWEGRAAQAYGGAAAVATVDVWDWAERDRAALPLSGDSVSRDARGRFRLYAKFIDEAWQWERLEAAVTHARSKAGESEADGSEVNDQLYETAKSLRVSDAGVAPLVARLKIATAASWAQITLARGVTVTILVLLVLGVVASGAGPAVVHDPGAWGSLTLLALAAAYLAVVTIDLDHEVRGATVSLKQSWLATASQAETLLGWTLEESRTEAADRDEARRRSQRREAAEAVSQRAWVAAPSLPWVASLRGRLDLASATALAASLLAHSDREAWYAQAGADLPEWARLDRDRYFLETRTRDRRHVQELLARAERLLAPAVDRGDDPIADLALARLLLVRFDLDQTGDVPLPPAVTPPECEDRAMQLTERALTTMESWGWSQWEFESGRATALAWAKEQAALLRPDAEAHRSRFDALTGFEEASGASDDSGEG